MGSDSSAESTAAGEHGGPQTADATIDVPRRHGPSGCWRPPADVLPTSCPNPNPHHAPTRLTPALPGDRVALNQVYVAFETIGLYKLPLSNAMPANINVGLQQLLEPVTAFGRAYRATPDDEEFECQYDPEGDPAPGDLLAEGSDVNAGRFLQSDLEGLSIILSVPGETLLLTSSQGDSSFHFYQIDRRRARHVGAFLVEGVADTDGVAYLPVPLGAQYPLGLLVVQNGEAPEPPDTRDINGFEFDGATQFKYVSVLDILLAR